MSITETPVGAGLPTHLDLPDTDGKPVENQFQPIQSMLLSGSLVPHLDRLHQDGNFYVGVDNGVYWTKKEPALDGCKAPDWFYVPNVPRTLNGELRRSYVMWQEVNAPLLVIEYVSGDGSDERDDTPETGKFWVYERGIRAAYYAIYDPNTLSLDVFELARDRYHAMTPDTHGRFRIPGMGLTLGTWDGEYQGCATTWLRGWDLDGNLIPTPEEVAERLQERADKFAAKLRELGLNPDDL